MKSNSTSTLLLSLVALDIVLFVIALFFPSFWFKVMHGANYVDPQALLSRTAGVWIAFTLLQFIAWLRWEKAPHWLAIVAGVRLTELFSDWIYLYSAESLTWFGRSGLFIAPIANLIFGIWLLRVYSKEIDRKLQIASLSQNS